MQDAAQRYTMGAYRIREEIYRQTSPHVPRQSSSFSCLHSALLLFVPHSTPCIFLGPRNLRPMHSPTQQPSLLAPPTKPNAVSKATTTSTASGFESVSTPRSWLCGSQTTSSCLKPRSCATRSAYSALHCSLSRSYMLRIRKMHTQLKGLCFCRSWLGAASWVSGQSQVIVKAFSVGGVCSERVFVKSSIW